MSNANDFIEITQNELKERDHIIDSVNLLVLMLLLVLVIITIWLFKYKRVRYIHETGLALFYGAFIGILIRYAIKSKEQEILQVNKNALVNITKLPEYIQVNYNIIQAAASIQAQLNKTYEFIYKYEGPLSQKLQDTYEQKATFDPEIFFNLLLPPIIFHAGYSMKKKHFFKNFGSILAFAFIGTIISCFTIGLMMYAIVTHISSISSYFTLIDCLFFGALVSATDPVTVLAIFNDKKVEFDLYALVFGESVLNDAVSIVLSQAIEKYGKQAGSDLAQHTFNVASFFSSLGNFLKIFSGAFIIGSTIGCLTALITKFTSLRDHPLLETALFVLMSYGTYLASEAAQFTGIVAVLFCGIFQAHYTYNNLSEESQKQTKDIFHLLNFLTENFIFIYIGITMFTFRNHKWEFMFIIGSFFAIIIGRILNIYPLSFLINLTRKRKITYSMQHMLFFSGLRGALAFALAIRNTSTDSRCLILTTTLCIVITTVLFCGGLTSDMLKWLNIKTNVSDESNTSKTLQLKELHNKNFKTDNISIISIPEVNVQNSLRQKIKFSKLNVFKVWHGFDKKYMKPLFTHSIPTLMDTLPEKFHIVARLFTTKRQIGDQQKQEIFNTSEE